MKRTVKTILKSLITAGLMSIGPMGDSAILIGETSWTDIEFEVALDSGSQEHVR